MLVYNGRLSLYCFILSSFLTFFIVAETFCADPSCVPFVSIQQYVFYIVPLYFLLIILCLRLFLRGFSYEVCIRSAFLGTVVTIGVEVCLFAPPYWNIFGWYMCVMAVFHYSEFLAIAWCNPRSLSLDSFILNHSLAYGVAAAASWIEFALEAYFIPGIKNLSSVSWIGLLLCIMGEGLRKSAMITAKANFNHLVQSEKDDDHQLVTNGVYAICRHPSYVGWFYWSIGTQLLLLNPICAIGYTIASWKFFSERVLIEEITLLNFFQQDYINYQRRVGTGLPFINGYLIDN